jgi:hypothetical protein
LQRCWAQCVQRIDHRALTQEVVEVKFAQITHHICAASVKEFERQQVLYNKNYTVGLKQQVDAFAQTYRAQIPAQMTYKVKGWRLSSSNISDFRRQNGERLLLVSRIKLLVQGEEVDAKTSNISSGGCLIMVPAEQAKLIGVNNKISVQYSELAEIYTLDDNNVHYKVVNIEPAEDVYRIALKCISQDLTGEFDQLIEQLMRAHKQRNRLNVDNTLKALSARRYNMATVAQLNALMVLSHNANRYHLLISQGHNLGLQAELLLNEHLIPQMVEQTPAGSCKLFFAWANSQNEVYLADFQNIVKSKRYESTLKLFSSGIWHKTFLLKADAMDPELADLGTSLPANVSPIVDKLNAPLPVKVARLTKELAKITLIEDVTYVFDSLGLSDSTSKDYQRQCEPYLVTSAKGVLRQVPFNIKELRNFHGTYRFSHDCQLVQGDKQFTIVNGYANSREAVITLSLKGHQLDTSSEVSIYWGIGEVQISLPAQVIQLDDFHKRTTLKWCDEPQLVKSLFKELEQLKAFDSAFKEDVQANKLDDALRNLVLSNLPKVSIFAHTRKHSIALTALTGHQYLPGIFIDNAQQVRLDALFSQEILHTLANGPVRQQELLFVAVKAGKVVERRLMSEFSSSRLMFRVLQHLTASGQLFTFALDMGKTRVVADDEITRLENKYIAHYSPGKAKKLDAELAFNLSMQMVDISALFRIFIGLHCG